MNIVQKRVFLLAQDIFIHFKSLTPTKTKHVFSRAAEKIIFEQLQEKSPPPPTP